MLKRFNRVATRRLALIVLSAAFVDVATAAAQKEEICHIDDQGEVSLLRLPEKAVRGHKKHGDFSPFPAWQDLDDDGFGDGQSVPVMVCSVGDLMADNADDCNDADAAINPEAEERCDGIDNNCDGALEEATVLAWPDLDWDGAGDHKAEPTLVCELSFLQADNALDCYDRPNVYPEWPGPFSQTFTPYGDIMQYAFDQRCDGFDWNCDGLSEQYLGKEAFSCRIWSGAWLGSFYHGVTLAGTATIDSYDSTVGDYDAISAGDDGNVCSNGGLSVTGSVSVHGHVAAGQEFGEAYVDYSTASVSRSNFPLLNEIDVPTACEFSGQCYHHDYFPSQFDELPADAAAKIASGVTERILLPPGSYLLPELEIAGNGAIEMIDDPAVDGEKLELWIEGRALLRGSGIINPEQDPHGLLVVAYGRMTFQSFSDFYGVLYGYDDVLVRTTADIYGAIASNSDVHINGSGDIHLDASLPGARGEHIVRDYPLGENYPNFCSKGTGDGYNHDQAVTIAAALNAWQESGPLSAQARELLFDLHDYTMMHSVKYYEEKVELKWVQTQDEFRNILSAAQQLAWDKAWYEQLEQNWDPRLLLILEE